MSASEQPAVPRLGDPVFSNGTEVEMFRANRCGHCRFADPEFGDCEPFGLGVATGEFGDLLTAVATGPANPLGVECTRFRLVRG